LSAVAKDFSLTIKEVKATFNSYEGGSGLSLGEASFDLGGLEWVEKQETDPYTLLIRGFNVNTSSKPSGDNINGLVAMRIEQWKLDAMTYGPGVFEMAFRNFDAASLVKIGDAVREFQTQASQQSTEASATDDAGQADRGPAGPAQEISGSGNQSAQSGKRRWRLHEQSQNRL